MTRKKYTSKFKTKVVLEALKERSSVSELAQKYDIAPQQIHLWKREFLSGAESVFDQKGKGQEEPIRRRERCIVKGYRPA